MWMWNELYNNYYSLKFSDNFTFPTVHIYTEQYGPALHISLCLADTVLVLSVKM